jgi:hypothetical protein
MNVVCLLLYHSIGGLRKATKIARLPRSNVKLGEGKARLSLIRPEMVGHVDDNHAELEEQGGLDQKRALVMQQVLPELSGDDLRQDHGHPPARMILADALNVLKQRR